MKQRQIWLLALMSILTFVMAPCLATAASSGQLELGVNYTDIVDNAARVNEYVKNGASDNGDEDGLAASIKLDLEANDGVSAVELNTDIVNSDNYNLETKFDAARILKLDLSLDAFQHIKDHETLNQMGATARDDVGGSQPSVTTDKIMAELSELSTPVTSVGGGTLDYDARDAYEQELSNEYIVTRRETEVDTELAIPTLPNIVFHAGIRVETRNGMEQAISVQKCDSCHVSATGKEIDERTEDFTFGLTGKFGLFTLDYEYKNRKFTEDGATPTYYYETAQNGRSDSQLLYEAGDYDFARTPDSDKDTHSLKARADFNASTNLTASYVKTDVESNKSDTQGEYSLAEDTLKTDFESYGAKLATKFGNLRLSLRGNISDINADDNEITFDRNGVTSAYFDDDTDEWGSAEERETQEVGIDAVYRLAKGTTARLGYNYEVVDREEEELGETTTQTFKASVKTRINKSLSGRLSYEYQDIEEPLPGAHIGIAQGIGTEDPLGSGLWSLATADYLNGSNLTFYWDSVYPNRTLESTSQPESVHEAKLSSTWTISQNMAATITARARFEENDNVGYEQTTYVPGISFWYAPNSKMNLTMSYSFNKQETENNMCVGWYHG